VCNVFFFLELYVAREPATPDLRLLIDVRRSGEFRLLGIILLDFNGRFNWWLSRNILTAEHPHSHRSLWTTRSTCGQTPDIWDSERVAFVRSSRPHLSNPCLLRTKHLSSRAFEIQAGRSRRQLVLAEPHLAITHALYWSPSVSLALALAIALSPSLARFRPSLLLSFSPSLKSPRKT
jgi:hypothetical protein